jgi:hypothetical protein
MKIISTKYTNYDDANLLKILYKYNSRVFFHKYKKYLSLYFVFFYLYNNRNEPLNGKLYYNEINDYYKTQYNLEEITKIYDTAYLNKINDISAKNIYKVYCDTNCSKCLYKDICY